MQKLILQIPKTANALACNPVPLPSHRATRCLTYLLSLRCGCNWHDLVNSADRLRDNGLGLCLTKCFHWKILHNVKKTSFEQLEQRTRGEPAAASLQPANAPMIRCTSCRGAACCFPQTNKQKIEYLEKHEHSFSKWGQREAT
jgi:hypothetical protein